jgi:hypothetical protein
MDFATDAQDLLDAAGAALPEVGRRFLAGGPAFAKICESLVVHPDLIEVPSTMPTPTGLPGSCAAVLTPGYRVVYVADCWPLLEARGQNAPQLPDPGKMTDWTRVYLGRCQRLADAVLDWAVGGGDCARFTVRPGVYAGPFSGICYLTIPVLVADDGIRA